VIDDGDIGFDINNDLGSRVIVVRIDFTAC
jgi:hypothetical protein